MITARDVARQLGISASKVYGLFSAGILPGFRIGRSVRFDPSDIQTYIESCRSTGTPETSAGASRSTVALRASGIDLANYFQRAGLKPKLTRTTARKARDSGQLRLVGLPLPRPAPLGSV